MDPSDVGLFRLAEARLRFLDRRQSVLAQNIANSSTPNYHARDLPSFASTLAGRAGVLAATDPAHLQGPSGALSGREISAGGRAPNGNTVAMEEQLGKVADTSTQQELVTNLYRKYEGMFRLALGRGG